MKDVGNNAIKTFDTVFDIFLKKQTARSFLDEIQGIENELVIVSSLHGVFELLLALNVDLITN